MKQAQHDAMLLRMELHLAQRRIGARNWLALELDMGTNGNECKLWATLAVRSRKRLLESSPSGAPCAHLDRFRGTRTCLTCPLRQVLVFYEFIAPHCGFAQMSAARRDETRRSQSSCVGDRVAPTNQWLAHCGGPTTPHTGKANMSAQVSQKPTC